MKRVMLVVCLVLLYFLYQELFARYLPQHAQWYKIALASLIMLIPAAILINIHYYLSEIQLLRRAQRPIPADGKRIAVSGFLRPYGEPLTSPFTATPCISYSYGVYHWKRTGKSRTRQFDCWGNAMTPCFIRTPIGGDIRICSYMEGTESKTFEGSDPEVYENAKGYLASASFEQMEDADFLTQLKTIRQLVVDDSGGMRKDCKNTQADFDIQNRQLEETVLRPGNECCVIGVWDSAKGGLVSKPFGAGAISVLNGSPDQAARTMRGKMFFAIGIALFLIAFLNFFIYGLLAS